MASSDTLKLVEKASDYKYGFTTNIEQEFAPKGLNENIIKFHINGHEMMTCSKKCKKVAKFAYMLKKNNENEILKTFESMLRKKMQKNNETIL